MLNENREEKEQMIEDFTIEIEEARVETLGSRTRVRRACGRT